jgi:aspartate ammonia-lyase
MEIAKQMRQEKDSLGVVEVPAEAMYGAQTARAVENYPISGMRASRFLIRAMGMVKQAAAEANGELGAISEERARAIAAAAAEVIAGKWDAEFVVDVFQAGAGVSFHMNANEVVANLANQILAGFEVRGSGLGGGARGEGVPHEDRPQGLKPPSLSERYGTAEAVPLSETKADSSAALRNDKAEADSSVSDPAERDRTLRDDKMEAAERAALGRYEWVHPNDHVNFGQSTNDVFPTAMRVGTLLALKELYPVLDALAGSFAAKGREFDGVLKAGRTHMQDAVPVRLGQEFAAYGVAVAKAKESIARAADSLRELGLGGSAVGTGVNTAPGYRERAIAKLAELAGEQLIPASDMRWAMQSCAPMAEVSGALRGLALEVIRISNDLRLLASGPNTGLNEIALPALQPGSSIMPGKINPVLAELAAMVAFQVVGNDVAVGMAVQGGQLELNVMMPAMAYAVLQSVTILTNMLRELDERCVRGITANEARCAFYAQSTVALATALNPYIGYAKAAEIVKESVATGRSVIEIARDKKLLSEEQIAEILDARRMTGE